MQLLWCYKCYLVCCYAVGCCQGIAMQLLICSKCFFNVLLCGCGRMQLSRWLPGCSKWLLGCCYVVTVSDFLLCCYVAAIVL